MRTGLTRWAIAIPEATRGTDFALMGLWPAGLRPEIMNYTRCRLGSGVEAILAIVLLVAALLKAYQLLNSSGAAVLGLIRSRILLAGVIQAEFVMSIWLLIGGFPKARFITSLVFFGALGVAAGYESLHALPGCGCFGSVKMSPVAAGVFDFAAVAALVATRTRRARLPQGFALRRRLFWGAVTAATLSATLWTVYWLKPARADGDLVVLEPQSWLNKPFPLFDEIADGNELRSGDWLVVMYSYDCESCLRAIPRYQRWMATGFDGKSRTRFAFVAMPPAAPVGEDPVAASPAYKRMVLRPDHDWFATTPVVVAIQNGRVLFATDGEKAAEPPAILDWTQ
jgi:hypothetical protein